MHVNDQSLAEALKRINKSGLFALDCEAFGLYPYLGDRAFSVIIADEIGPMYFNFLDYGDGTFFFKDFSIFKSAIENPDSTFFMHNAKYDMALLAFENLFFKSRVHCTMAIGRVVNNNLFNYGLDALAKRIGLAKDSTVEEYIKKNKLSGVRYLNGFEEQNDYYDKVPFDLMYKYGCQDAVITRALGLHQISSIETVAATSPVGKGNIRDVYLNELEVTKACFDMEWNGAKIDLSYAEEAGDYERRVAEDYKAQFYELTGENLVDSPKALAGAADKIGFEYPRNEPTKLMIEKAKKNGTVALGNPSFSKTSLDGIDHPFVEVLFGFRKANLKHNTYYQSFQKFRDGDLKIHCNFKQAGTETGRMSCATPNLQNVPKRGEDKSAYPVRKVFVPEDDHCLLMLDFEQMEYRLMLEYAEEMVLIDKIRYEGLDIHDATKELMGIEQREYAKTINFMLLYGGGNEKLAKALKTVLDHATELKRIYFSALPHVKKLIRNIQDTALQRGFIVNWFGRRCHLTSPEFAYAMPNYLIQGGCADIVKRAMVECRKYLIENNCRSKIILQIHDELVFQIHKSELHIAPVLKEIMESVYPYKHLPMLVGVEHSWKSWGEKEDGFPTL